MAYIVEVHFKKQFTLKDDQDPNQISEMYLDTMGFEATSVTYITQPQPLSLHQCKTLEEIRKCPLCSIP